ncbi:AAA family ATPase [Tsuneonella mangrovi]|uniref:AAA family ATPase n=1 Tax=Tsuneonella mangrovi TaxID=1982042 RepID=UPI000BA260C4|nr:AAA family ATPase [Tsuneonella mangrovi]
MGTYKTPYELHEGMTVSHAGRSVIVAEEGFIEALKDGGDLRGLNGATLVPLASDSPLPAEVVDKARVLVLEVDAANEASLRRLATARVEHAGVAIIAALREADVALVRALIRQGVSDVVDLPFSAEELSTRILDALSSQAETVSSGNLGKTVAVMRASGGTGATTMVTHLAEAVARHNTGSRGVCLVDLDIQGGDVASYVGAEPVATIESLLDAGSRLDAELIQSAITESRYGFGVIAAPEAIIPIDKIDVDHLLTILRMVRSLSDHVLIDLPPAWTDWSLSTVHAADRILLVTDTSISGLRQAKRCIKLLNGIDVPNERIELVVNRLERHLFRTVGTDDVTDTLRCDVAASLVAEGTSMREAQDQGMLLFDFNGKSRFGSGIDALANSIVSGREAD